MRYRRFDQDEWNPKIVLDGAIEGVQRHVLDQCVIRVAGVVDQDVDPPQLIDHIVDQPVAGPRILEIGRHPDRRTAGGRISSSVSPMVPGIGAVVPLRVDGDGS